MGDRCETPCTENRTPNDKWQVDSQKGTISALREDYGLSQFTTMPGRLEVSATLLDGGMDSLKWRWQQETRRIIHSECTYIIQYIGKSQIRNFFLIRKPANFLWCASPQIAGPLIRKVEGFNSLYFARKLFGPSAILRNFCDPSTQKSPF